MAHEARESASVTLLEISRILEETARLLREHPAAMTENSADPRTGRFPVSATARRVRAVLALRRLRRRYIGLDVTDAAWTLVLEIYAAHLEGRKLHQRALAAAAKVPETTALHATRRLLRAGLFESASDPSDRRLLLIGLTDPAIRRLDLLLAESELVAAQAF